MISLLRTRRLCSVDPAKFSSLGFQSFEASKANKKHETIEKQRKRKRQSKKWRHIDNCYWMIGIVTGGLELWEGRPCAQGLFRKKLWGDSFAHILKRPLCWLEHLSLNNETGLDPPGIRVRAIPGLAVDSLFWNGLIENLAKVGYESKNLHMVSYDWRLSFQNTEIRDQALSRLKSQIELMYVTNGFRKVVVVPHSMGVLYFLHFLKWVETPPPMGGGGGTGWCDNHIRAIMNTGPPFLGVPKMVKTIFSAEGKEDAFVRVMASGILNSGNLGLQTLEHFIQVYRTWDSIISLMPKGGETIWGNLDWFPEEGNNCDHFTRDNGYDRGCKKKGFLLKDLTKFGRIISFGKAASQLPSSLLALLDSKELWTSYNETSRESIKSVAETKAYTAITVYDLLRSAAPKTIKPAEVHFSHDIAEHLDDPKYTHHKYWSNPLETQLPEAPNMEIYCLYGVGIPTERPYVYQLSASEKRSTIRFQINSSAEEDEGRCLKGGVYFGDGDESVPVISAGFMCAKGWRGRTRFNPSAISTYVREYIHKQASPSLLQRMRGLESGDHIDIMRNYELIEDVVRVAAGATGSDIGGDRIFSDIIGMSKRIDLRL
ncbi:hypothetical protein K1719_041816 [Acacia pycnantha]|nr:hypothetical protein K1719_041816 [Acacia pycnantha]